MGNKGEAKESLTTKNSQLNYKQKFNIDVASGLIAGVSNSGLFNPWDRALYLSVKHNRPFLSRENFNAPYQGFSQALVQRAFLGSIYYIAQGELNNYLSPYLRNHLGFSHGAAQFFVGMAAGSIGGMITNSISAVKYHTWGQEHASFRSSVYDMWVQGGFKPFIKGTKATMGRDMIFGSTYEMLRSLMNTTASRNEDKKNDPHHSDREFIYNASAAGVATIVSSPLNYVRNMQYATSPHLKPPTLYESLTNVWNKAKNPPQSFFSQLSFFQQRFRIGWGTARVAVGMAVGQKLFDLTQENLRSLAAEDTNQTGLKRSA